MECLLCGERATQQIRANLVDGCEDLGDDLIPICDDCLDDVVEGNVL